MQHLLSIAGSDSSGGAGIQADLKTFSALGTYGMTAITALTAQNTQGVVSIWLTSSEMLTDQIDAVFSDIRVDAVKIGMLGNRDLVLATAAALRRWKPKIVVLDPVMVSKSGHHLLAPDAVQALRTELLPLASVVTPNIPEAELLCGQTPGSLGDRESLESAARLLLSQGSQAVILKGGHREGPSDDILMTATGTVTVAGARLDARHTHGTGCSLSSALAVFLSQGLDLESALRSAKSWVTQGIAEGIPLGHGIGPIHHFHEWFDLKGIRR